MRKDSNLFDVSKNYKLVIRNSGNFSEHLKEISGVADDKKLSPAIILKLITFHTNSVSISKKSSEWLHFSVSSLNETNLCHSIQRWHSISFSFLWRNFEKLQEKRHYDQCIIKALFYSLDNFQSLSLPHPKSYDDIARYGIKNCEAKKIFARFSQIELPVVI
jgi:hypothetical protein